MKYPVGCLLSLLAAVGCASPVESLDSSPDAAQSEAGRDASPNPDVAASPDAREDGAAPIDAAEDASEDGSMSSPDASEDSGGATMMDAMAPDASQDAAADAAEDAAPDVVVDAGVCAPGLTACGAMAGCVDTRSNNSHCGACNNGCAGGRVCVAGACACPAGQTMCGGACVDTQSNNGHCGACGNACAALSFCVAGSCQSTCSMPRSVCAVGGMSACVDTSTDLAHCGGCNSACSRVNASASCVGGMCGIASCNAGFGNCDSNAANGCETNVSSSVSHCGACGTACAPPTNASASCVAGTCGMGACNAGFGNCDANAANGCEVNLTNNPSHCGACANACAAANGTPSCVAGACGVASCNAGFANCDANASNGCEVNTRTNVNHCGACGAACPSDPNGTASCASGMCTLTCAAGYIRDGGGCTQAPRLIAPQSASDVTVRAPRLRWAPIPVFPDAEVELCSTSSCATVLQRITVTGATSVLVPTALAASSVVYWRVRGARGATRAATWSRTWQFRTPSRDATGLVYSSHNLHSDFDADGFDDVSIGSPVGGPFRGGVVLAYRGAATGLAAGTFVLNNQTSSGTQVGFSVANAGDVNGDGYTDILYGAPGGDPSGRTDAGFVQIYAGGSTGLGVALVTINGVAAGDRFGSNVAGLGDVNGDGYADIAVGASAASPMGRMGAGTVSIFFGSATGVSMTPTLVFDGAAAGDGFGARVSGLGDVNADGYADVAIGAPGADVGGLTDAGLVNIYYGSATGLSATPSRVLTGVAMNARFGAAVTGAGDVNHDGYSDVIIGAPGEANGAMASAGAARLYIGTNSGIGASAQATSRGSSAGDEYGFNVSSARDVNGDGFDDVLVSAPGADPSGRTNAGSAFLFNGQVSGVDFLSITLRIDGATSADSLGQWLAPLGDVNRDGLADYAIGSPLARGGAGGGAGQARIVFGSTAAPALPLILREGTTAGERFGQSIAALTLRAPSHHGRLACAR